MMLLTRWLPTWTMRPVRRCASTMASPCSTLCTIGFSTYTSLPASMASMAIRECQWSGVATMTASTSFRARISL